MAALLTNLYPLFLTMVCLIFIKSMDFIEKRFVLRSVVALAIAVALAHVNRWLALWPEYLYFPSGHMTFCLGVSLLLGQLRRWTLAVTLPLLVPFGVALVDLRFHSELDVMGAFPLVVVVFGLVHYFWRLPPVVAPLDIRAPSPLSSPNMFFGLPTTRDQRLELLKNVVLFKDLSMRDLAMVNGLMHERRYLADEVIFDEGEEGQGLFVVLSGRVKIALPEDVNAVLIELGPGAFFGEVALLDQSVRTAQARAIEDTHIVALFRAEFYSLLETHSAIASRISFQLARVLAARLRQAVLRTGQHHDAS